MVFDDFGKLQPRKLDELPVTDLLRVVMNVGILQVEGNMLQKLLPGSFCVCWLC